jgi:hypothetical protein
VTLLPLTTRPLALGLSVQPTPVHDDVTAVDLQIDGRPRRSSAADAKKHIVQGNGIPLVNVPHPPAGPISRSTGEFSVPASSRRPGDHAIDIRWRP